MSATSLPTKSVAFKTYANDVNTNDTQEPTAANANDHDIELDFEDMFDNTPLASKFESDAEISNDLDPHFTRHRLNSELSEDERNELFSDIDAGDAVDCEIFANEEIELLGEHSRPISSSEPAAQPSPTLEPPQQNVVSDPRPQAKVGLDDFELLRVIGRGAFGKVFQVKKKDTGVVYALKVMTKERVIDKDLVEGTMLERGVLEQVKHPFVVQLRFAFQTKKKLYLVMDYISGGQLFGHLTREGLLLQEHARLYFAEMVLALEELHRRHIIHRDLKPENVLMGADGHLVLTDFGCSKAALPGERANSFVGTELYMAPEMLDGKEYGTSVDWWSFGAIAIELLTGEHPFYSKNRCVMLENIKKAKVVYPKFLFPEAVSLIKGLLTRDVEKRLGCGPLGVLEVKRHPFFKDLDWESLFHKEIPAPVKPLFTCVQDVQFFSSKYTKQPVDDSPCQSLSHSHSDLFAGFSYVGPSHFPEDEEYEYYDTSLDFSHLDIEASFEPQTRPKKGRKSARKQEGLKGHPTGRGKVCAQGHFADTSDADEDDDPEVQAKKELEQAALAEAKKKEEAEALARQEAELARLAAIEEEKAREAQELEANKEAFRAKLAKGSTPNKKPATKKPVATATKDKKKKK